jgi:predicted RND superfamily exporter protein
MTWNRPSTRVVRVLLFAALAGAWVLGGLPRLHVGTGIDSFLPSHDGSVASLGRLAKAFGGDPVVVLLESSKPDTLLDENHLPELLRLEGRLSGLGDVAVVYGPATTLNQTVIRVQDLLAELSGQRDALREAGKLAAAKRFDKRYGALVVRGLPGGLPTLRNQQFVNQVIYGNTGVVVPKWTQFVPNHNAVAIYVRPRQGLDQDAAARLSSAVRRAVASVDTGADRVTVTGAPVVTAELADEARSELPRLGLGALAAVALALFLVPWTRRSRRLLPLVPMVIATLMTLAWFGWRGNAVSLGAVAFLPVILGVGSYYPVYLAQAAHRRRVLAVAGSAAAAFGSLSLSPLPFVRDLGQAIAIGICLVVLTSLVLGGAAKRGVERSDAWGANAVQATTPWARLAVVALALVAAVGWAVLPRIPITTDPQELIHGLHAFTQAEHAEEVLGYSGEVDVVLSGPDVLTPAALSWLGDVQARIVTRYGDKVRPIVSPENLLEFLGPHPSGEQVDAAMRLLPSYVSGAAVTADRSRAVISLGGRWRVLNDSRDVIGGIRAAIQDPPPGYHVDVTGLPVAASRGYELVSSSRYQANILGVVAAVLMLLLVLRRRGDVLLALSAAAIATGLGVFAAWAAGVSLNPLTLALGPLTAAAGCEFAVLLAAGRRSGDSGLRRSVYLAATLSAAGYGVLALSGLLVVREFGIALVASLGFALVSALVVTRLVPVRIHRPVSREPRVLEQVGA